MIENASSEFILLVFSKFLQWGVFQRDPKNWAIFFRYLVSTLLFFFSFLSMTPDKNSATQNNGILKIFHRRGAVFDVA